MKIEKINDVTFSALKSIREAQKYTIDQMIQSKLTSSIQDESYFNTQPSGIL